MPSLARNEKCPHCQMKMNYPEDMGVFVYAGAYYCGHCRANIFVRCPVSRQYCLRTDLVPIDGQNVYERWLRDQGYIKKDHKGVEHLGPNLLTGPDGKVYYRADFYALFYQCQNCGLTDTLTTRVTIAAHNGPRYLCAACAVGWNRTCADCGCIEHEQNALTVTGAAGQPPTYLCRGCRQNQGIASYSFKPAPVWHRGTGEAPDGKALYLGFELEVEADDARNADTNADVASLRRALGKLYYYKSDGSLRHGFEVVSHPMSWAFITGCGRPKLCEMLAALNKMQYCSFNTNTCGLHIHASRVHYSNLHCYKLQRFIFQNADFIHRISRRTRGQLAGYAKLFDQDPLPAARLKEKRADGDRYKALNLTGESTIEFRLFKGTLEEEGFFRAFEFVHGLTAFCKHARVPELNAAAFTAFLAGLHKVNRNGICGPYPALYKFCCVKPEAAVGTC